MGSANGKRVWQTPREEDSSWSTPTIYEGKEGAELITSGTKYYRGYDPLTGKELWRLADGVDVKIPTPIAANDLYFLGGGSAHEQHAFYAVRAGVKGEIAGTDTKNIAWQSPQIKPHIVTPIVYGDYLYVCTDNGILSPYEDLPSPVVVTVWGVQLQLDGADDERLGLFLEEYGDGHTAPEFGVTCRGGTPDPGGAMPDEGINA